MMQSTVTSSSGCSRWVLTRRGACSDAASPARRERRRVVRDGRLDHDLFAAPRQEDATVLLDDRSATTARIDAFPYRIWSVTTHR